MKTTQKAVQSTAPTGAISPIENQNNSLFTTSFVDLSSTEENLATFAQIKQLIHNAEPKEVFKVTVDLELMMRNEEFSIYSTGESGIFISYVDPLDIDTIISLETQITSLEMIIKEYQYTLEKYREYLTTKDTTILIKELHYLLDSHTKEMAELSANLY